MTTRKKEVPSAAINAVRENESRWTATEVPVEGDANRLCSFLAQLRGLPGAMSLKDFVRSESPSPQFCRLPSR